MYREGTNVRAVYDWIVKLEVGQEAEFDVQDTLRKGFVLNDTLARVAISPISRVLGRKFKTKSKYNADNKPRLFVTRVS